MRTRDLCQTHGRMPSIECADCERVSKALQTGAILATDRDVAEWHLGYVGSDYELSCGRGKTRALARLKFWATRYGIAVLERVTA